MNIKVKYWDNIEPQEFEVGFDTEREAYEWIDEQMTIWWDCLCYEYPDADICWVNRLLDCSNKTEIYIPNATINITCELLY